MPETDRVRGNDDEEEPCPWCGEEGCERSCTGALLADADAWEDLPDA